MALVEGDPVTLELGTVMVIADYDAEGSAAEGSLGAAFVNFIEQGFDVLEARPPRGEAKDLNALACQASTDRSNARVRSSGVTQAGDARFRDQASAGARWDCAPR